MAYTYSFGRPRMFESPEDFEKLANAYFKDKAASGGKVSWTGLCLAVGANTRRSLDPYKNGDYGEDFSRSVQKALMVVENWYEENTTGADRCFTLKNFGWTDKQELEHSGPNGSPVDNKMTITFVGMDEHDGS